MRPSVILAFLLICPACSRLRGPSATIREAYEACNAGRYSDAQQLMSEALIASAAASGGVKALCDQNTREGTIQSIATSGEEIRGEGATVITTFTFKDGSKLEGFRAPLLKEKGIWKVTLKTE